MGPASHLLASLVLFLVAAKFHGRALRLEREAAGVLSVVFGGTNPPVVEALWSAERWRFWLLVPALAIVAVAAIRLNGSGSASPWLAALTWAPALGFTILAAWSVVRTGAATREQLTGTLLWAAATVLAAAAVALTRAR